MRPILAEAVDLARRALLELQPEGVGEHLGVTAEDEYAATHHFATTLPGYRGWQWAVVVAAPPEAERATVSESALLPGPDALVAPDFIPWERRVRPGDLAPGDLLAPLPDDPRLVPGYLVTGDPVVDDVCEELGQGRPQVLSREGREEAADRWFIEYGPDTEMARAAPSTCRLCGFYVPLAGALRASYGVCANALGADGHVVHAEYGCGAHSDTELPTGSGSPLYEAYDDAAVELISPEDLRKTPAPGDATPEPTNVTAPADTVARESVVESPDTVASQDVPGAAATGVPGGVVTTSDAASQGAADVSSEVAAHASADAVVRQDVSSATVAARESAAVSESVAVAGDASVSSADSGQKGVGAAAPGVAAEPAGSATPDSATAPSGAASRRVTDDSATVASVVTARPDQVDDLASTDATASQDPVAPADVDVHAAAGAEPDVAAHAAAVDRERAADSADAVVRQEDSASATNNDDAGSADAGAGKSPTTSPGPESTTDFAVAANPAVAAEESDQAVVSAASAEGPRDAAIAGGPSAEDAVVTAPASEGAADVPDFGAHPADTGREPSTPTDSPDADTDVESSAVRSVSDGDASSPAEYHDAWAVSAVRVRHGAEGATGASGAS